MPDASVTACERWFVRRGIPHFIEHYDARQDIWTRSLPVLAATYLVRGFYALDLNQSVAFNLLASALVVAILLGTWALSNLARHRPAFAWPREVGLWELGVYLFGPALPALLLGEFADAGKAVLLGVVLLGVVYFGTSYGVVPMLRWAGERTLGMLGSFTSVLGRALPLLLVTITFLFWTTEVWQVMGTLYGVLYWVVLGLFFVIGLAYTATRLPGDLQAAGTLASWEEVRGLVTATPAATLALPAEGAPPSSDLSRREYLNLALVGLFARALQVMLVAVAVGGFLVLLGTLAIPASTVGQWSSSVPNVLASWTFGGRELSLTEQLLRVAGFLATFTGLSFSVYLSTDPSYREAFRSDLSTDVREAFAVRAAYRYTLGER